MTRTTSRRGEAGADEISELSAHAGGDAVRG